ncbi:T9SS type A sorting domain-containing protein [Fluviicola sp.]|uniref:T9SS type A sorting domain-containing protein n=1 Tax=Fluviicola sp. TaxID=1917219 RepID=UPI0031D2C5CA
MIRNGWILLLLLPQFLLGQSNLVPNPSFENCLINPGGGGSFYDFDLYDWFNPNTATPDYYSISVYPEFIDQNIPDGQACIGISAYDPALSNLREYVSCELLDTLIANKLYYVSFYASLSEGLSHSTADNLGVNFSDTALHAANTLYFNVETHVLNFNNEIIEDTVNWVRISGLYEATGSELFLTIGNFHSDTATTPGHLFPGNPAWQAYYFIDNVSVIPLDSLTGGIPAYAGPDQTIYIEDSVFIGQKISNLPGFWSKLDGTPIASNTGGLYVSPQVTTTYVVEQTLNGIYSTDTVTVFVIGLGLEELALSNFKIAPNPNKGAFTLDMDQPLQEKAQLILSDNTGREVYVQELSAQSSQIRVAVSPGTYFAELCSGQKKSAIQRIIVE